MLQPPHRLRRSAELKRVRQLGEGYRHPLAVLVVLPNDLGISRFAFVASRRVGNAVQRNRARRLLREVVRLHMFQIEVGWDCVWIAREATPEAVYAEVETAVLHLLARSKLLRNQSDSETRRDA